MPSLATISVLEFFSSTNFPDLSHPCLVKQPGILLLKKSFSPFPWVDLHGMGWKAEASWSILCGKWNKDEEDHTSAIREILVALGFAL
ncbi:mRNA-decapping enzyme subunit 2-like [Miscanthus floridulus]|uniref:mRNA-decapping enzyme subunit 2-like n=1 Tax=Miscanthus floridulus TaxID=154761 RepID=UPI0034591F45